MKNILCLSTSNYWPTPTRKQNIMNRMSGCNIIYVDPPITLIAPYKDPSCKVRLEEYKKGPKQALDHIKVYASPPVYPFYNKYRSVNRINQKKMAKWLAGVVKENGFGTDFYVWVYSPMYCDVIEPLAKELKIAPSELWARTIYDCVDRHSAYPGHINPEVVDKMEEDLAISCGAVFSTAQGLHDRLSAFNKNAHLIPNGCAFELFNSAADMNKESDKLEIGFVGMLQECIDYDCLRTVSKAFPGAKISLIGKSLPGVDLEWLKDYPNIVKVGLVPQTELPGYIKNFDLCLNIFADNELSKDVSPLKFYEYLATGKPIVSTPVPLQVRDFEDCIYIASGAEDIAEKCKLALEEAPDDPRRARRIENAKLCSWDERVKTMKEILSW